MDRISGHISIISKLPFASATSGDNTSDKPLLNVTLDEKQSAISPEDSSVKTVTRGGETVPVPPLLRCGEWTSKETIALIEAWKSTQIHKLTQKVSLRNLSMQSWELIAEEVNRVSKTERSAKHCRNKMDRLKRAFWIYEEEKSAGQCPDAWEFWEVLDSVLRHRRKRSRPLADPETMADSTPPNKEDKIVFVVEDGFRTNNEIIPGAKHYFTDDLNSPPGHHHLQQQHHQKIAKVVGDYMGGPTDSTPTTSKRKGNDAIADACSPDRNILEVVLAGQEESREMFIKLFDSISKRQEEMELKREEIRAEHRRLDQEFWMRMEMRREEREDAKKEKELEIRREELRLEQQKLELQKLTLEYKMKTGRSDI